MTEVASEGPVAEEPESDAETEAEGGAVVETEVASGPVAAADVTEVVEPNAPRSFAPAESVRPLELFFDLVFVFAITQIASVLAARPTPQGLARMMTLLAITWWMYGGYAWLTNALDLTRARPRLLLLTGMAAFFVMSLAVPYSFNPGHWALLLGGAYLVVVTVHAVGFVGTSGHRGIARIGPLNLISALIVLAAGIGPERWRLAGLAVACLVEIVTPFVAGLGGFTVGVGHFVERHSLAVLILLGESIVEVGSASGREHDLVTVVAGSLLALALTAAMWWLYFEREDHDSERLLEHVAPQRRARVALYSYGYAYYVVILGIAVAAVGAQKAIYSFTAQVHGWPAALLPLGVGLYLVGLGLFRYTLSGTWPVARLVAGVVAVAAGLPAARWGGGWVVLAAMTAVLVLLVLIDSRGTRPSRGVVKQK
ncbi:MAG TPA: low temperature requirement protein A [Actinocrinis sp.]|nr:low temperature requirement protein A [Actinocrinis sp.]